jgi:hypothetical protein
MDALPRGGHQERDPSNLFELVSVGPAGGTDPIFRKIRKFCSWFDTIIRIPAYRIILVATDAAFVLIHPITPFLFDSRFRWMSLPT